MQAASDKSGPILHNSRPLFVFGQGTAGEQEIRSLPVSVKSAADVKAECPSTSLPEHPDHVHFSLAYGRSIGINLASSHPSQPERPSQDVEANQPNSPNEMSNGDTSGSDSLHPQTTALAATLQPQNGQLRARPPDHKTSDCVTASGNPRLTPVPSECVATDGKDDTGASPTGLQPTNVVNVAPVEGAPASIGPAVVATRGMDSQAAKGLPGCATWLWVSAGAVLVILLLAAAGVGLGLGLASHTKGGSTPNIQPGLSTPTVTQVPSSPTPVPQLATPNSTLATPSPSTSSLLLTFQVASEDFPNPERGFYVPVDFSKDTNLSYVREGGVTIGRAYLGLANFLTGPLTAGYLSNLNQFFDHARNASIKLVARFCYACDGVGPDAPIEVVLNHISQLTPLLTRNADTLAALEAGFIGAWGEWHDSTNNLTTAPAEEAVLFALLSTVPAPRFVHIRYPNFKIGLWPTPLNASVAFTQAPQARVAYHNDCFLSDSTDAGTFEAGAGAESYVAQDTGFVPIGGETCASNPPLSDCSQALQHLAKYHWAYLNADYHPDVLDSWQTQGCFPDISKSLGYRFVLLNATIGTATTGGKLTVAIWVKNVGFGMMLSPRAGYLVVTKNSTFLQTTLLHNDTREWVAGATQKLTVTFTLALTVTPGSYSLAVWLPDASPRLQSQPEYAVRFANTGVWDEPSGLNILTRALLVTKP